MVRDFRVVDILHLLPGVGTEQTRGTEHQNENEDAEDHGVGPVFAEGHAGVVAEEADDDTAQHGSRYAADPPEHCRGEGVQAILEAAGSSFEKVLKASVFVKDMNMFGRINTVYGEYFNPEWAPARELVQVAELPRFVNVEISVIATV